MSADDDSSREAAPEAVRAGALVTVGQPRRRGSPMSMISAFAAQMLGQSGRRRGLRAGRPALEEATNTYLETEWSGDADRRAQVGGVTRTQV